MILCVIPARGGSKRLPRKNLRMLGDKPLLSWTIDAVRRVPDIQIVVSSDDPKILALAEFEDVQGLLRPPKLATDTSSVADVCIHALDWYEANCKTKVRGVMLLQPTSPFRTTETILKGIDLFFHGTVVGVSKSKEIPYWTFHEKGGYLEPLFQYGLEKRSQDLPTTYRVNGSFYLIKPRPLREYRSVIGKLLVPLETGYPEDLDIDTLEDFNAAERELQLRQERGSKKDGGGRVSKESPQQYWRVNGLRREEKTLP